MYKNFNMFKKLAGLLLLGYLLFSIPSATDVKAIEGQNDPMTIGTINNITQKDSNVYLELSTGEEMKISFLKDNLLRIHLDKEGEFPEYPTPNSPDHVTKMVDKDFNEYKEEYGLIDVTVDDSDDTYYKISTKAVELRIEKESSKMSLYNKNKEELLWSESEPLKYDGNKTIQTLKTKDSEYFYGGGQQNGYYAHKNNTINIAIGGGWDAGAASSPVPFYLSTEGYGVMRNTFKPGVYDFSKTASFSHKEDRFDAYYFVEDAIPEIINEYTELTGKAALMPEFGFYLGHADCFNGTHNGRGDERTLLGKGLDKLNEYVDNDMPLGWFLPNDGYGCGYGGLDNLEKFVDEADDEQVEVGLWTQSNLYPDPSLPEDSPLRRDLNGEVQAGTRAIKTDVAWVGQGYSMALNATRQAAEGIMKEENSGGARPFVITVDGWAGTQRYSTLWSGDQYGGNWEYIRMHIPTYIGAGLSGNPNVGSDMDGIFGGDAVIQTRDHQWKAFTPIQIDMDGWASTNDEKDPWNYGEPYASINRMYLKLKAQMMPYVYTIAEESTRESMPMVRGMMLEYPEDPYTYGTQTQYQYMWGPNLLVAPVYDGDDHAAGVRNEIYLPDENQVWIDYFTGDQYQGGSVVNNFDAPLWKTPVFVKNGAIIPMAPENNSINGLDGSENRIFDIYPSGESTFTLYEDDGKTIDYKEGKNTRTKITSKATDNQAVITVGTAKGKGYDGMVKERGTEFLVNTRKDPQNVTVTVGGEEITLQEVTSEEAYNSGNNVYFYNEHPNLNKYATPGSTFEEKEITTSPKLFVKVEKTDITANEVVLTVDGFNNIQEKDVVDETVPNIPGNLRANDEKISDNAITVNWDQVDGENVTYDLMIDGVVYSNVYSMKDDEQVPYYHHTGLNSDTDYAYRIRAVNSKGASDWSDEIQIRTNLDRFRNVPKDMSATANSHQPGSEPSLAVDGNENTLWHTQWFDGNVLPHTFTIDMKLAYQLDKFEYLPRTDAGNGTILEYDMDVSLDGKTYKNIIKEGTFERNGDLKTITFDETVTARYIKLTITDAVGGFGSAQEFRPYKKDKTEGVVVGENIPNGSIDDEDLLFFASYMGVDQTDTAWDQVSKVDINYNGVIDAYDLMYVAGQLGETPLEDTGKDIKGAINIQPDKKQLKAGEEFSVDIVGKDLNDINAFNLELTFNSDKYELIEVLPTKVTEDMLDYSTLSGIGNAEQRVMAAFSNKGKQETLNGTETLATIKLKSLEDTDFNIPITRSLLVNTGFDTIDTIGKVVDPDDPEEPEEPENPDLVEVLLTNQDIIVSGDGSKMQDGDDAFARLIDGEISESSLAELKWRLTPEDGISLPLDVHFEFEEPQQISKFEVYNRPQYTNGKLKVLSAKAYDEDNNEYDLGTKNVASTDESVIFNIDDAVSEVPNGTKFSKIDIVFEESHSGPLMLSVAEVEFTALVQVDKAELKSKITEAEAINTIEYTEETVNALNKKLTAAKDVVASDSATQAQIDEALGELQAAIEGLQKKPEEVDKSQLEYKLVEAEAVDVDKYTEETVTTLNEKLTHAQTVFADEDASQEEVDAALAELQAALDELEEKVEEVDKSELKSKVEEAKKINESKYTETSVDTLKEKQAAAEKVLADTTATKEIVEEAIAALQAALDDLEEKVVEVDKSKLKSKVKEAKAIDKEKYTEASVTALNEKLAKAEAVIAKARATKSEVENALTKLQQAMDHLEKKSDQNQGDHVDVTELEKLIEKAKAIANEDEKYTKDSYQALQTTIAEAESKLDSIQTKAALDQAVDTLQSALDNLVTTDTDDGMGESDDSKDKELPSTATSTYNWLIVGLLLSVTGIIVAYVAIRRKRIKE
ncbi:O-GlcNAcase NagJ precursor [Paraliobacillus sp. PM-2]|uniref:discoidin domain-containing protein n=1 Tax=Paraliobacillus sp. PM-2 TaxID=1462524 RepID=UPI00061BCCF6|nr:discoidin domain-containing protein [Paraliobacillus sp. PM-2]CQR47153.1 O-GlcNAcase NagJ precursor [Paraliobacillus sp. PM-2]